MIQKDNQPPEQERKPIWPTQRRKDKPTKHTPMKMAYDVKCSDCAHLRQDETCSKGLGGYDGGRQKKRDIEAKRDCSYFEEKRIVKGSAAAVIDYESELREIAGYLSVCGVPPCDHHIIINSLRKDPAAHVRYLTHARQQVTGSGE